MEHFTPVSALIGGALIGLSAAILWVAIGRIAGISGIASGLADWKSPDTSWRLAFLAALLAAPLGYEFADGPPAIVVTAGPAVLVVAGLLVGFGTRLGGGCTSGHGVCGMARLSRRSIVATILFMSAAAATVFLSRHVFGR
jgi:uncharacterized membrane protein YedE/YeeE